MLVTEGNKKTGIRIKYRTKVNGKMESEYIVTNSSKGAAIAICDTVKKVNKALLHAQCQGEDLYIMDLDFPGIDSARYLMANVCENVTDLLEGITVHDYYFISSIVMKNSRGISYILMEDKSLGTIRIEQCKYKTDTICYSESNIIMLDKNTKKVVRVFPIVNKPREITGAMSFYLKDSTSLIPYIIDLEYNSTYMLPRGMSINTIKEYKGGMSYSIVHCTRGDVYLTKSNSIIFDKILGIVSHTLRADNNDVTFYACIGETKQNTMWCINKIVQPINAPVNLGGHILTFDLKNFEFRELSRSTIKRANDALRNELENKVSTVKDFFNNDKINVTIGDYIINTQALRDLTVKNNELVRSSDTKKINCGRINKSCIQDENRKRAFRFSYSSYNFQHKNDSVALVSSEVINCEDNKGKILRKIYSSINMDIPIKEESNECVIRVFDDHNFSISPENSDKGMLVMRIVDGVICAKLPMEFYPVLLPGTDIMISVSEPYFKVSYRPFQREPLSIKAHLIKFSKNYLYTLNTETGSAFKINADFIIEPYTLKDWFNSPYYEIYDADRWREDYFNTLPLKIFKNDLGGNELINKIDELNKSSSF